MELGSWGNGELGKIWEEFKEGKILLLYFYFFLIKSKVLDNKFYFYIKECMKVFDYVVSDINFNGLKLFF